MAFDHFDEDVYLSAIEKYKITNLNLVPPIAVFLAKTDKLRLYDISSVKGILIGGAPLSQSTERALIER